MKVFIPSDPGSHVGGGWTFARNLRKGLGAGGVFSVDSWHEADVCLIPGVTMLDRDEVEQMHAAGKPLVLRVDNIPRKSRNKRNRVMDNLRRYVEIADAVVYQSRWAADYCRPVTGYGAVVYNGVDLTVFHPAEAKPDHPVYLFAYHGKNETKGFWLAHYLFQRYARDNPAAEFRFIYNFKSELAELEAANFDFWNGEKFTLLDPVSEPEEIAEVMRQCTHLIYPAFCDAAPNVVLEARACGLEVVGTLDPAWSGVAEMLSPDLDISLARMAGDYERIFSRVLGLHEPVDNRVVGGA